MAFWYGDWTITFILLLGLLYTFAHFYPNSDLQRGRFHNLSVVLYGKHDSSLFEVETCHPKV